MENRLKSTSSASLETLRFNEVQAEKRSHGSLSIPYSYYFCSFPDEISLVPPHWHNEWEISRIQKGTGLFFIDGKEYTVLPGDVIFVAPGMIHSIHCQPEKSLQYETLVFSSRLLPAPSESRDYMDLIGPLNQGILKPSVYLSANLYPQAGLIIQQCMNLVLENQALSDLALRASLVQFLVFLWQHHLITEADSRIQSASSEISQALTYMEEHYCEEVRIEDLAAVCCLSSSRFMKRFADETGQTALSVLQQIRIRHACSMLMNSEANVAQIAQDCGYSSLSNFNRRFLQYAGCTPSAYRRHLKSHPAFIQNGK